MPHTALIETVIYDQSLYHGNGDVAKWVEKISNRFAREARHFAPVRTGELREGIRADSHQVGPREVQGIITSYSPHTLFVLRGTGFPNKGHGGRIYTTKGFPTLGGGAVIQVWGATTPTGGFSSVRAKAKPGAERRQHPVRIKGYWLKVPPHEGFEGFYAVSVHGQFPNNFFLRAWRATARDHRAIRGVLPESVRNP